MTIPTNPPYDRDSPIYKLHRLADAVRVAPDVAGRSGELWVSYERDADGLWAHLGTSNCLSRDKAPIT